MPSPVSVGADAGVAVELVQALGSVQTAVLVAVVVVHAAVVANVARSTHTPTVQKWGGDGMTHWDPDVVSRPPTAHCWNVNEGLCLENDPFFSLIDSNLFSLLTGLCL